VAGEKRTVCMGLGAKIDLHPAHTLPIAMLASGAQ
jgi:hypothetical protein